MLHDNRRTYETVNLPGRERKRVTEDKQEKKVKSRFKVRAMQETDDHEGGEERR